MKTQKDHSNPIPALNVDSLKVDLVVIQNACSEKEDSNSETASKLVKECSLNSKTKDVHAIKYKMSKAKERCMTYFRSRLFTHHKTLDRLNSARMIAAGQGMIQCIGRYSDPFMTKYQWLRQQCPNFQILNETSNKAKIEKEIDVLETMNIELEHSVATLRKENETLKQHYKDYSDSGK
ncbi:hypothetical protein Tco_0932977, partial [Tanacetum coccineum]